MGKRSEFNRCEGGKKGKNTRSVRVEMNSSVIHSVRGMGGRKRDTHITFRNLSPFQREKWMCDCVRRRRRWENTTKRQSESDESGNVCLLSDMSYHLPKGSSEKLDALFPLLLHSLGTVTHIHTEMQSRLLTRHDAKEGEVAISYDCYFTLDVRCEWQEHPEIFVRHILLSSSVCNWLTSSSSSSRLVFPSFDSFSLCVSRGLRAMRFARILVVRALVSSCVYLTQRDWSCVCLDCRKKIVD